MTDFKHPGRHEIWNDLKGRLENYKKTQTKVAKKKGVYEELMNAPTLTRARQAVYGRGNVKTIHRSS